MILYPMQEHAVQKVLTCWEKRAPHGQRHPEHSCVGIAPTGFGKTPAFYNIIGRTRVKGRTLILVHTKELLHQHLQRWEQHFFFKDDLPGIRAVGMIGDGHFEADCDTIICIVKSLAGNEERMRILFSYGRIGKIVIDETHRSVTNQHMQVINAVMEHNPYVRLLGLTATHSRGDRRGLLEVFSHVAFVVQPRQLAIDGYIAWPETYETENPSPQNFFRIWKQFCAKQNEFVRFIIFTERQQYAKAFVNYFNQNPFFKKNGLDAGVILDYTSNDERMRVREQSTVIANCNTLREGFDIEGVRMVGLTSVSPYNSLPYYQAAGRGMRPKRDAAGNPLPTESLIVAPFHHDLLGKISDVLGVVIKADEVEEATIVPHKAPVWYVNYKTKGGW